MFFKISFLCETLLLNILVKLFKGTMLVYISKARHYHCMCIKTAPPNIDILAIETVK